MAHSPEPRDETARKAKPPITASPAFRWVVAIWFAALLGVGSLIVPVVLLERASVATGLGSLFPQAAPPLGFTARALIAGLGTVGGGMLGLFFARLLTRERQPKPAQVTSRRPFSASEDLGEIDDLDEPAPAANTGSRRRALAIEEEQVPSDFLNVAPLPGLPSVNARAAEDEPLAEPEPDYEEECAAPAEPAARQMFQPLDTAEDEEPFELDASAELTDAQEPAGHDAEDYIAPEPHFARQEFIAVAEATAPVVEQEEPEPAPRPAMEPLAFSQPSMARPTVSYDGDRRAEDDFETAGLETGSAAASGFTPIEVAEPESEENVSDKQIFNAPEGTPDAALEQDGEGLVQLVQRLGATLEKHREWVAEKAMLAPAASATPESFARDDREAAGESPVLEDFDPAAADEAAEAMAAWFGSSTPAPAIAEPEAVEHAEDEPAVRQQYAPFAQTLVTADDEEGEDDEDIAELAASFSLPLAMKPKPEENLRPAFDKPPVAEAVAEPVIEVTDEDEEEEDHSADSDVFGSLNPFKDKGDEFVRIEEPEPEAGSAEPAVLFPGQETRRAFDPPAGHADGVQARASRPKPSNDDNERALREALMNLQRMSK